MTEEPFDSKDKYKVKIELAYDGTDYSGWQRQPTGVPTIQGTLESVLTRVFDEDVRVCGSGRTDAGVHARKQVAHFWVSKNPENYKLLRALNRMTPESISVSGACLVPPEFHAIASSDSKTYKYYVWNNAIPEALRARYSLWVRYPLSVEKLNAFSDSLIGKHDFKSFQTRGTETPDTVREIIEAGWRETSANLFEFTISGTGFLKQMVRNIVGTQLDLSLVAGSDPAQFAEILKARDRRVALGTAPPHGLFLHRVRYPQELDNKCRKL